MSTRSRRDDWLPGGQVGDRLAAMLVAATAPAHPGELAGEEAAVAAFRAAHSETAAGHGSTVRSLLARVLTIKAVIVVAVAGSAGVVAATTGMLPSPWSPAAPAEQSSTSTPTPTERAADARTAPTRPDTTASDLSVIDPSVDRLCQEYAARGHGAKALKNPRFQPLVEAAGGEDTVADYCTTRLRQSSKDTNNSESDDQGRPAQAGKPESPGKPENAGKPADTSAKTGRNGAATATPQPHTGNTGVDTTRRSAPLSTRPSTPGSPAHGTAKSPETPGGAEPPSQGG